MKYIFKELTSITLQTSSHFTLFAKKTVRFETETVAYRGLQIWNLIPDDIKVLCHLQVLKNTKDVQIVLNHF